MADFAGLLLGILLLQTFVPIVAAQEVEIAYDNGTPGGAISLPYAPHYWSGGSDNGAGGAPFVWIGNHMLAVRFTPPSDTMEVLGVRFYIAGDPEKFNVWLFDSNKLFVSYIQADSCEISPFSVLTSTVPYSWTVTPTSTGWVYLNLGDSWHPSPILITGDFYVAIEFTVDQKPTLGVSMTNPRSGRGWMIENESQNGWSPYSIYAQQNGLPDGNLMIRAVTAHLETQTINTTQTSTQSSASTQRSTRTSLQELAIHTPSQEWTLLLTTTLACLIVAFAVWRIRTNRLSKAFSVRQNAPNHYL